MTIIDTIKLRKSVRSYSGKPLDTEDKEKIKNYIKSLPQPLNGKARIELISLDTGPGAVKLGTYGVISGAKDYLILAYEQGDFRLSFRTGSTLLYLFRIGNLLAGRHIQKK